MNLNRPAIHPAELLTAADLEVARRHSQGSIYKGTFYGTCTGHCRQGRDCTCCVVAMPTPVNPYTQAAEACTDAGFEDEPRPPLTSRDGKTALLLIIVPWALVMAAVGVWLAL